MAKKELLEARQKEKQAVLEAKRKEKQAMLEARKKEKEAMLAEKRAAILAQKAARSLNNNNNNEAPKVLSPEERKQKREANKKYVHATFPAGQCVFLSPAKFADQQNRKKSQGWNLGISPQGFIVPDASTGAWGKLRAVDAEKGAVFLESSHSESFRLEIGKDRLVSTKGKSGPFAQFEPLKSGNKFWSFRCVGHETPAFLALSPCGLVYVASEESKDTKFLVSTASSVTEEE